MFSCFPDLGLYFENPGLTKTKIRDQQSTKKRKA